MQFEEQTTQSLIGVLGGDLIEGQTFTVFGENVKGTVQQQFGRYSDSSAHPIYHNPTSDVDKALVILVINR